MVQHTENSSSYVEQLGDVETSWTGEPTARSTGAATNSAGAATREWTLEVESAVLFEIREKTINSHLTCSTLQALQFFVDAVDADYIVDGFNFNPTIVDRRSFYELKMKRKRTKIEFEGFAVAVHLFT